MHPMFKELFIEPDAELGQLAGMLAAPDGEVVLVPSDFPSVTYPWLAARQRSGMRIRWVPDDAAVRIHQAPDGDRADLGTGPRQSAGGGPSGADRAAGLDPLPALARPVRKRAHCLAAAPHRRG